MDNQNIKTKIIKHKWKIIIAIIIFVFLCCCTIITGLLAFGYINARSNYNQTLKNMENLNNEVQFEKVPSKIFKVKLDKNSDLYLNSQNSKGQVVVLQYGDYECPACQSFFNSSFTKINDNLIKTGRVDFYYRSFPIFTKYLATYHYENAVMCVQQYLTAEKAFTLHSKLYSLKLKTASAEASKKLDVVLEEVKNLGFNSDSVLNCIKNEEFKDETWKNYSNAFPYNINVIPSFIIGNINEDGSIEGELVSGVISSTELEKIVKKYE